MKLSLKKYLLLNIAALFIPWNMYAVSAHDLLENNYHITSESQFDIPKTENNIITPDFLSVMYHDDHCVIAGSYYDPITDTRSYAEAHIPQEDYANYGVPVSLNSLGNAPEPNVPMDHSNDHSNDLTRDDIIDANHAIQTNQSSQSNTVEANVAKAYLILKKARTSGSFEDHKKVMASPIITAHFKRTKGSIEIIKNEPSHIKSAIRSFLRLKQPQRTEQQLYYERIVTILDACISGRVSELLDQIEKADLPTAKGIFIKLKELLPFDQNHTFLLANETGLIHILGIDIMKAIEKYVITRPDYIAAELDTQSQQIVADFKEKCLILQQTGNGHVIQQEQHRLYLKVRENGANTNLTENICLAIAEDIYINPITNIFRIIAHSSSIDQSEKALHHFETQILNEAKKRNLVRMNEIRKDLIERYSYDLLKAARDCHQSHPDYVAPRSVTQTINSDVLASIIYNIERKSLPMAHAELIHLEKQVAQGLEELNITNSVEQKEYLIQEFGSDVRKEAQTAYKGRQDHKDMIDAFNAIKVEDTLITILDEHTNYAETTDKIIVVAESVLENAELCQLPFAKDVEPHIFSSLHVMRNTNNPVEFIYNATAIDIMLTDLQNHSEAILDGKTVSLERCTELTSRAVGKFIEGLNPITQAQNMGHALVMAGKVATYPIIHPIDTTERVCNAADKVADFLITNAYFTTSLTVGKLYLSPIEYQARLDRYLQSIDDLPSNPVANLTAENWIDLIAQIAADFVFGKGFVSVMAYIKQIDAMGKISKQSRKMGEILIHGVDAHLNENPIFITAEGIVIKMSNKTKDIGGAIKSSKALFEKSYIKIAEQLEAEIEAIREFYKLNPKHDFANFGNKHIKVAYEHILGIETKWGNQENLIKLSGFHHDLRGSLENSKIFKFLNKVVKENGCYSAEVLIDGLTFEKTFFPQHWSRTEVISKIHEAYENFRKSGGILKLGVDGKYFIEGFTNEGIKIEMYMTQSGIIKTAYPSFK